MNYEYGAGSKRRLATCNNNLQMLFNAVGKRYACTILEGHRGEEKQNDLYEAKRTKVKFPNSKHNAKPSNGIDVAPDPVRWSNDRKNLARFYHFAGYVKAVAEIMDIKIRWGGDWDGDRDFSDQTFDDLVHFEEID